MAEGRVDDVVELLRRLVAIDSSNPDLVAGGAGEVRIADFVTQWLAERGFTCHRLEDRPGRPSVLAIAPGTGGGRSLMLNGHIDTVSVAGYENGAGLDPVLDGGNLYGRGAYDMKSGVAAIMVAAARAAAGPHRGDIVLALVADEEFASAGTEEVLRHIATDAAIVVEPTNLDVVVAHRGFVWAKVTVHGVAAHGSRPDLGVDAIAKAGRFLTALETLQGRLVTGDRHPLLGTGSVHASLISGGAEASTYPARCHITVERRTIPGEDAATVDTELRQILESIAAVDSNFRYQLGITLERSPFSTDPDSAIVRDLVDAFRAETEEEPHVRGEPFWTDCALLGGAGIPTVMFGVDGAGAHAAREWVTVDSLRTATATLAQTIQRWVDVEVV